MLPIEIHRYHLHMPVIQAVPADPTHPLTAHARALFTQYGEFLRHTQSSNTFNFPRYDEEIATLPAAFADHRGEVLLAFVGTSRADDAPAACIAWRDAITGPPGFLPDPTRCTAEIKRLFVAETHRGQRLARHLIAEAMARIAARHYTRIVLDSDHVHMPAALALYRSFGFREYAPGQGNITFLDLNLSVCSTAAPP